VIAAHQGAQLRQLDALGAQHLVDARLLPHIHRHLAQLARPSPHRFQHLREALRPDDHEGHEHNQDHFAERKPKHAEIPVRAS
jgi:hypothetical protein